MPDINGIPYVESTDLVSGWPTVSQSVAQEVSDQLASKGDVTGQTWTGTHNFSGATFTSAFTSAYITYTPTTSGISVGNGTTYAKYQKIGRIVTVNWYFQLGSTSTITGNVYVTLPFTATQTFAGVGQIIDSGVGVYDAIAQVGLTRVDLFSANSAGTFTTGQALSSSSPFTWTTNDQMMFTLTYEATS